MKWKLGCAVGGAGLLVSALSQPAECMRRMPQTPDEISNLSCECEKGQLTSCTTLGIDYLKGQGVAKDENKARELLERACGGGAPPGGQNPGVLFSTGRPVAKAEGRPAPPHPPR